MIIAYDLRPDISDDDRLPFNSFENRHFREVSFYEAFIWFSPFFRGIWDDAGAHIPEKFSVGQHGHFPDDCRIQSVLPVKSLCFFKWQNRAAEPP